MRDQLCDVISYCVCCGIGKISLNNKIVTENPKRVDSWGL